MADQQVFPTKGNLIVSKRSLSQAQLGYELMDRKRNILIREMVLLSDKAKQLESKVESTFSEAYRNLQQASIMLGIKLPAGEQIPIENRLKLSYRSVMGVIIPKVELEREPIRPFYGAVGTNSQLDIAYVSFNELKYVMAMLAEIECSIYRLAIAIKKTQKRANALQNILIPKYRTQVKFIVNALEEKEREEFGRQKIIKSRKEKHKNI